MSWLEVAIDVKGELAEPVAELFSRYAEGGVALEQLPSPEGSPASEATVTIRAYIPLDKRKEEYKQLIEEGLWHLSQIAPLPDPVFRTIEQGDWAETWRQHYHPTPIGKSLLILPAWVEPTSSDRKPIILEPGMAFGTGTHPTTQMCLLAIEDFCRPGDLVIDLGCGSGVLSIGAIHCGAARVLAFDIDEEAITSARHNLVLNQMTDRVALSRGSMREARELSPKKGVPLLVANILAPILIDLLGEGLSSLVSVGGVMILSGILDHQLPDVLRAAGEKGLMQHKLYADSDWRTLAVLKE